MVSGTSKSSTILSKNLEEIGQLISLINKQPFDPSNHLPSAVKVLIQIRNRIRSAFEIEDRFPEMSTIFKSCDQFDLWREALLDNAITILKGLLASIDDIYHGKETRKTVQDFAVLSLDKLDHAIEMIVEREKVLA
jgi:hypothetical protein